MSQEDLLKRLIYESDSKNIFYSRRQLLEAVPFFIEDAETAIKTLELLYSITNSDHLKKIIDEILDLLRKFDYLRPLE